MKKHQQNLSQKGEKAEETPEEIIDEISLGENDDEGMRYEGMSESLTPEEEEELDMIKDEIRYAVNSDSTGTPKMMERYKILKAKKGTKDPMNKNKEEKEFTIKYYPSTQREADDLEKVEIKATSYEAAKDIFQKKNPKAQIVNEPLNESFLHMQKLAGIITEAQYQAKKK